MIIYMSASGKSIYEAGGGFNEKKVGNMSSTMFNLMTSMAGSFMNRATNSKMADTATSPCLDALDIADYNYGSGRYPLEAKAHPNETVEKVFRKGLRHYI
ncbi:MAG: hypothetical protein LBE17_12445 [Treponema sp.]|nr:hypothetical protein [Treponema sp.]